MSTIVKINKLRNEENLNCNNKINIMKFSYNSLSFCLLYRDIE
ncbi:hypothetical protein [Sedimentibacter sp. zth1]|nr:hypothetical protein [Sedimentibacter sp. zth1]